MTAACDLLEAELALDRIEAEVATELPAHVRSFAAAHVTDTPPPPMPPALLRASTVTTIRQAMTHTLLEDRARRLARLVFPATIDNDARVAKVRSRSTPSWADYFELAAMRDAAARERFDTPFIALMHELHGTSPAIAATGGAWPARIDGWHARGARTSNSEAEAMWRALAAPYRLPGTQVTLRGEGARPRTFLVIPKREVMVVLPATIDTPAARFSVLHEFGHALVGLLVGEVPRVLDEAVAAFVARRMEQPGSPWFDALAAFARARRVEVARALDAIERGISALRPTERPPWALWHDPGAQAAYVEAEVIADTIDGGDLAASIASKMRR